MISEVANENKLVKADSHRIVKKKKNNKKERYNQSSKRESLYVHEEKAEQ